MNLKFTRLHIRFKIGNVTFFGLISATQTLKGLTSRIGEDKHIILWDLEDCTQHECLTTLKNIQLYYRLGQIYVLSDKNLSYRAICFTKVNYMTMLKILINTDFIDSGFIQYTVQHGEATLRMTKKFNRDEQDLICIIPSEYRRDKIPKNLETVIYETGLIKRGVNIG